MTKGLGIYANLLMIIAIAKRIQWNNWLLVIIIDY